MSEIQCKRCGQCCHYIHEPTGKLKKCKYLGTLRNGTYFCKRWKDRNTALFRGWGFRIDKWNDPAVNRIRPTICAAREHSIFDYPDCPYNNEREMAPWIKK